MIITDDYYYYFYNNDDAHEVFTTKCHIHFMLRSSISHIEIKEQIHFMIQLTYLLLCYSWFIIKTCLHAQITQTSKESLASSWHPSPKYEDKYSLNLLFH